MGKRAIVTTASAAEPIANKAADGAASSSVLGVLDAYFSRRISRHEALDALYRFNAPFYIASAFTQNSVEMVNRRFAADFGGFRVSWPTKDGSMRTYGGELNEDGATTYAECLAACDQRRPVWVEHQDPMTGEWRRW